jgi:Protein of unknown function (DUF3426)
MAAQTDGSGPRRRNVAVRGLILAFLLAGGLAGCGGSNQAPQTSIAPDAADGVYIVQDGKLGRLDEDSQKVLKTWDKRTNLTQNLQFLVIDDSIASAAPDADRISLQKVARVRNNVNKTGAIRKAPKAEWVVANVPAYRVPLTVTRNSDNPRTLLVTSNEPLEPGLYSLIYRNGKQAVGGRFGIGWSGTDKEQYASRYCVDRYLSEPAFYRPCAERDALESAALKVSGLKVRKQIVGGKPTLVLEGRLTNSSAQPQDVPELLAVINDKQGRELTRWAFRPKIAQLRPGATVGFQTGTATPPKGTAGVAVLLMEGGAPPKQEAESLPFEQSFLQDTQLPNP